MASELPDRLSELYHEALAQPPEVRPRFVRDACGEDERLRHELESLLGYMQSIQE